MSGLDRLLRQPGKGGHGWPRRESAMQMADSAGASPDMCRTRDSKCAQDVRASTTAGMPDCRGGTPRRARAGRSYVRGGSRERARRDDGFCGSGRRRPATDGRAWQGQHRVRFRSPPPPRASRTPVATRKKSRHKAGCKALEASRRIGTAAGGRGMPRRVERLPRTASQRRELMKPSLQPRDSRRLRDVRRMA